MKGWMAAGAERALAAICPNVSQFIGLLVKLPFDSRSPETAVEPKERNYSRQEIAAWTTQGCERVNSAPIEFDSFEESFEIVGWGLWDSKYDGHLLVCGALTKDDGFPTVVVVNPGDSIGFKDGDIRVGVLPWP